MKTNINGNPLTFYYKKRITLMYDKIYKSEISRWLRLDDRMNGCKKWFGQELEKQRKQ